MNRKPLPDHRTPASSSGASPPARVTPAFWPRRPQRLCFGLRNRHDFRRLGHDDPPPTFGRSRTKACSCAPMAAPSASAAAKCSMRRSRPFRAGRRQNAAAKAAIARRRPADRSPRIHRHRRRHFDAGAWQKRSPAARTSRCSTAIFMRRPCWDAEACPVHVLGGLVRGPENCPSSGSNPIKQIPPVLCRQTVLGVSGVIEDGFFDYSARGYRDQARLHRAIR